MRHFLAASALLAVSFVSLEAQAKLGPQQAFKAACDRVTADQPATDPASKAHMPLAKVIMDAAGVKSCGMAWEAALKLTTLDASGKGITDVTILQGLPALTKVNLSKNEISDVTPLAGLTAVKSLDLSENKITDVAPLAGLASVTTLNLAKNQIADISGLTGLAAITELRVNDNQITKVWAVTDMKTLKKAYLSSNKIENLAPLARNKKLAELAVRNNPVKNCPDKGKVEVKGKEIDNTDLLKGICKDEAWKKSK